ncbi:MAG: Holliday junction resolvase RuvX [Aquificaceae bacterium]
MKILSVDYGRKRIGLAFGDTSLRLATPIGSIENKGESTLRELLKKVKELNVSLVLLGLPITPSRKEGERSKEVKVFFEQLREALPEEVDIILWDERYTTEEAYRMMEGLSWKKKKTLKDSLSAYAILLEYMESL